MASAQEHGEVEVRFISADEQRTAIPLRARTDQLAYAAKGSNVDRRQLYPVAYKEGNVVADENSTVAIFFKSDAADVIESEESELVLNVTKIDKATGRKTPTALTFGNMTGFTSAGTVDVTCVADIAVQVAYYTVPAGIQLALGHPNNEGKFLCYLGDDTA